MVPTNSHIPVLWNSNVFEAYIRSFSAALAANLNGIKLRAAIEMNKNSYYSMETHRNKLKRTYILGVSV